MFSETFSVWNKPGFLREFTRQVNAAPAGGRVLVTTMAFVYQDPLIKECFDSLVQAARRGVQVLMLVDAYTFLISDDSQSFSLGPLFYGNNISAATTYRHQYSQPYKALEALREAGGRYAIINQPGRRYSLPIAGRSHIKLYMVDDAVFIGGCNFNNPHETDLMLSWQDTSLSQRFYGFAEQLAATGNVASVLADDNAFAIDNITSIFLDNGTRNQSVILDQAIRTVGEAQQSVFITCQFFPGGRMAAALRQAHKRGVTITIAYNDPSKNGHLRFLQYISGAIERVRNPAEFFAGRLSLSSQYLHAKLLATEKSCMLGSHNYVDAGVRLGTAEIALLRHDPALSAKLISAIR